MPNAEITLKAHHLDPKWKSDLDTQGLLDIKSVSQREFDWFEAPNRRRGGWSGVTRIVLNPEAPEAEQKAVFLKIQQNHFYRSWRTFLRRRLTYEREFVAINQLSTQIDILPEVLFYARWSQANNHACLLVTKALDGWTPLDKWLSLKNSDSEIDQVLSLLADTLRAMHKHRWAHFGLFQKHIFLSQSKEGHFKIKLIDLEKARKTLRQRESVIEDVSRFLRHSQNLSQKHQIHFLQVYFQTRQFSAEQKALIRKMRGAPKV